MELEERIHFTGYKNGIQTYYKCFSRLYNSSYIERVIYLILYQVYEDINYKQNSNCDCYQCLFNDYKCLTINEKNLTDHVSFAKIQSVDQTNDRYEYNIILSNEYCKKHKKNLDKRLEIYTITIDVIDVYKTC